MATMKTLLLSLTLALLTGCSTISAIWPKPHDPEMFAMLVDVKIGVDSLNCENKDWAYTQSMTQRLKVYAQLRKDPQADSIAKLQDALDKAKTTTNKTFCESIIKLNKTRIDVIADAWRGR
jgi:hypothetical protein